MTDLSKSHKYILELFQTIRTNQYGELAALLVHSNIARVAGGLYRVQKFSIPPTVNIWGLYCPYFSNLEE